MTTQREAVTQFIENNPLKAHPYGAMLLTLWHNTPVYFDYQHLLADFCNHLNWNLDQLYYRSDRFPKYFKADVNALARLVTTKDDPHGLNSQTIKVYVRFDMVAFNEVRNNKEESFMNSLVRHCWAMTTMNNSKHLATVDCIINRMQTDVDEIVNHLFADSPDVANSEVKTSMFYSPGVHFITN